MLYLPRFLYYIFLLIVAIFIASPNFVATVIAPGIFFYLPISFTVWTFSTVYEKIFKAADYSADHSTNSISLKLMYVTIAIALLLFALGAVQESMRTTAYGVAAVLFAGEQLIRIKELKRILSRTHSN